MYLFSHLATTLNVTMMNVKRVSHYIPEHYQMQMVIKGSISIKDNGEKYILKKDDIILLYPCYQYKVEAITDNTVLDISIPANFFHSMVKPGYEVVCNSAIGRKKDYFALKNILTDMVVYYNKEDNHLKMCSLLYSLMDYLNDNFLVSRSKEGASVNESNYSERIDKIANYINTNYPLPLNLQTLADHMFLTPQYLSKFIKQNFGLNFNKYLNKVRMEHAMEELKHTNHSVITIAFNNGFASTTSFNKTFKEFFNVTPTSYRQAYSNSSPAPSGERQDTREPSLEHLASDLDATAPDLRGTVHRNIIDITGKKDMRSPWLKIINVGIARNILSHNFHKIVLECQDSLKFDYARFENIFSDKIISLIPNSSVYNFTNFDDIISFLIKSNLYPFIELGSKPEKIFYVEDNLKEQKHDESLLEEVIRNARALDALLKHSINRFGIDYVSHWKFELWYPQSENLELLIKPSEYIKGYKAYSEVIQKYLPSARIGGPGFNTSGNMENFVCILKELQKHGINPDFISAYLFPYEPDTYNENKGELSYRILSPDPSRFKKVLAQVKEVIHQHFSEPLPVYITVFNSNISPEIFVANSSFQAAFLCKNALELNEADALGYYIFTDISNEYATDQPSVLSGVGLIDTYGIKKPSYFAFEFLSRLGNNLIAQGSNYIMTSSHDNKYQLLAYNYVHYNKYFCINCRDRISFQNTYSVFEPGEKTTLQFELSELPPGRYKIRKHILSRSNGSFLDEAINILERGNSTPEELLYMMLNMQTNEVDYYKSICIPRQEVFYANCEDSLSLTLELEPHEVNYISISRKL
ncbi:MAG TPA: helix-turn-helix domain-containing protein [Clostridiales bacterium]|nr:helix-turn-helix domain-containing protein [Clostridiales bacterium]